MYGLTASFIFFYFSLKTKYNANMFNVKCNICSVSSEAFVELPVLKTKKIYEGGKKQKKICGGAKSATHIHVSMYVYLHLFIMSPKMPYC